MFEGVSTTVLLLFLIALLVLLIVITLGAVVVYSGLFTTPEIGAGKPPIGKIILAYKFYRGPYKECGQNFTEVVFIAPDKQTLGVYYDDPEKVESSNLRYIVGSVISHDSEPVDEDLVKRFSDRGFKLMSFPEVDHVVKTTFPYVTSLSAMIGAYKVFWRLGQYIEEKKLCAYPFLEYCCNDTIHYFAPLSKQDLFFAPECKDEKKEEQASSDFNDTLESTQSTLTCSFQDTTLESNEEIVSAVEDGIQESISENLKSQVSATAGDGSGDKAMNSKAPKDLNEENNGNSDVDVDDNSSSSSFEVLKNETTDV